ncbi:MAG: shikimate kinase [Alphaproteobacteria bacterium]|nr:shikimate kinase [Alphaproteobacteria bacterium]
MTSTSPELHTTKPVRLAAPWRSRTLVLIGLMGAGKSSVGHRLAKEIGWRFVDSDDEIVEAAGCSISDMFAMYGEPIFRDLEQRVITRLLHGEPLVLATGGGAWMQPHVRELIKRDATSVWLRADLDVLLERVSRRGHRPLLETGDKRAILSKLMDERYPVYAQADIAVDSGKGPHDNVVKSVIAALNSAEVNP